jgi:hypothetical protein
MAWYTEPLSVAIVALHAMYVLVSATVENAYCRAPLTASSSGFLLHETYEFAAANNRIFLERPEWLRIATCFSAYIFLPGYLLVLYAAVAEQWSTYSLPITLLLGMKIYAFSTYHYAEFTSDTPGSFSVTYISAEGPYLLGILLVLWKVCSAQQQGRPRPASAKELR